MKAAGFAPCRVDSLREAAEAFVVRWTPELDLENACAPVVLLIDRDLEAPAEVAAQAAHIVPLPDDSDITSLLAWSAALMHVLQLTTKHDRQKSAVPEVQPTPRDLAQPVPQCIAIGVSTGGPEALGVLFRSLSGHVLPPIAVVQHIPAKFLQPLIERLSRETGYPMQVAKHGARLTAGTAMFAPGDKHLRLIHREDGSLVAHLTDEPPVRGHRPAAEILF
ncbi:MAG: chemotaxis protein CheB, partial [Planctomycetes bacterium]|nr:chemotaxis protein CheB [Planctomycetota bacterium]